MNLREMGSEATDNVNPDGNASVHFKEKNAQIAWGGPIYRGKAFYVPN